MLCRRAIRDQEGSVPARGGCGRDLEAHRAAHDAPGVSPRPPPRPLHHGHRRCGPVFGHTILSGCLIILTKGMYLHRNRGDRLVISPIAYLACPYGCRPVVYQNFKAICWALGCKGMGRRRCLPTICWIAKPLQDKQTSPWRNCALTTVCAAAANYEYGFNWYFG